jgi:hypothetical protein
MIVFPFSTVLLFDGSPVGYWAGFAFSVFFSFVFAAPPVFPMIRSLRSRRAQPTSRKGRKMGALQDGDEKEEREKSPRHGHVTTNLVQ